MSLTTKEICQSISDDLKKRRYTNKYAAELIGTTPQNMSNMLSGRRPFSRNMAQKFSKTFGYSIDWILFGNGEMYVQGKGYFTNDEDNPHLLGNFEPVIKESRKIRVAEHLLQILDNKVAISAFHAYLEEKYDEYDNLLNILESNYAYDIPYVANNPKAREALLKMRRFFTDAETEAAKELVIIEQKAAAGEIIATDAEVERFRKKIEMIMDSYK